MKALVHRIAARPWITAAVVAVVVLIAGGGYWLTNRGGNRSSGATLAATTRLVTVSTGTIKQTVSASGTIEPAVDDSLSFSSSGLVTSVKVAEGDTVKKGQLLGTIDSAALRASVAEAKSTLASAQAKVTADEDDSSTTSAQLSADKASVTAAHGQVSSAQTALDGAVIRSPVAGVVASVNVAAGEQVGSSSGSGTGSGGTGSGGNGSGSSGFSGNSSPSASSTSGGSGSAAFEVIGTGSWLVNTSVDDTQVGLVAKGDQAQITTDATSVVYGLVSSVAVVSSDSSGSASYPVVVAVTGSPSGLHAGATATVSIIYRQLSNVLTVPTLAVRTDASGSYVYVSASGKQTKRAIKVGASSGGLTQVMSGLSAGEQVVEQIVTRSGAGTTRSGSTTRNGNFPGGGFGGGFPGGGGGFGGGGFGGGFGGGGRQVGGGSGGD